MNSFWQVQIALAGVSAGLQERSMYNMTASDLSKIHLEQKDSLSGLVNGVCAVAVAMITVVVICRLIVRRRTTGRLFLDDYLIIFASIFTIVVCSTVMAATRYGLGQHVWNVGLANIMEDVKMCILFMFVANIFYAAAIAVTKLSVIASYMTIFKPRGTFKAILWTTGTISTGLGVTAIITTIFQCHPIKYTWSLQPNDTCIDIVSFLYASTAINIATDLILCTVPLPLFWRLQLPVRQRIIISGLFFVGGFACIASIIRLAFLHLLLSPIDVTYVLVASLMWSIAECTIGIVCVSLPALRSVFARILPSVFSNAVTHETARRTRPLKINPEMTPSQSSHSTGSAKKSLPAPSTPSHFSLFSLRLPNPFSRNASRRFTRGSPFCLFGHNHVDDNIEETYVEDTGMNRGAMVSVTITGGHGQNYGMGSVNKDGHKEGFKNKMQAQAIDEGTVVTASDHSTQGAPSWPSARDEPSAGGGISMMTTMTTTVVKTQPYDPTREEAEKIESESCKKSWSDGSEQDLEAQIETVEEKRGM